MSIACVVGGHGEVEAAPILIRRVAERLDPPRYPEVERPIRIPESRLLQANELERAVRLAASRAGADGAVLVLVDCDDCCPAELGPQLLSRARTARPDVTVGVVVAKREYETWFVASAESLRGRRGLADDVTAPHDPEAIRGAKEWLTRHMGGTRAYRETLDQPALTGSFDLEEARRSDSFDKCLREIERLVRSAS